MIGRVSERNRIPMLDGWRAISILLVMAGHLLPLGPSWLGLNELSGAAGMAIFFCLSGFLIVTFLYQGMPVPVFLQKRIARIVPLAWTAVLVLVLWQGASSEQIARRSSRRIESTRPLKSPRSRMIDRA